MAGIILKEDIPMRSDDKKLAILDMKVWLNDEKYAVYEQYEKLMKESEVIHAESAQSAACKRSVHNFSIYPTQ